MAPGRGTSTLPAMSGYATSVTLRGASPHVVAWHGPIPPEPTVHGWRERGVVDTMRIEPVDLVGRPIDEAIAEWLASLGEAWSQLTFFVFDPDSWR